MGDDFVPAIVEVGVEAGQAVGPSKALQGSGQLGGRYGGVPEVVQDLTAGVVEHIEQTTVRGVGEHFHPDQVLAKNAQQGTEFVRIVLFLEGDDQADSI
jgi:hypothetical protein